MARITVEDCLTRENNRFSLVLLASKRAKQLLAGATAVTDTRGNKSIVSALREIAASKVRFMSAEETQAAELAEAKAREDMQVLPAAPLFPNASAADDLFNSPTNGQNGSVAEVL